MFVTWEQHQIIEQIKTYQRRTKNSDLKTKLIKNIQSKFK